MHPLRLVAWQVRNARNLAQPRPQLVGFSAKLLFFLATVGQVVAMPASKDSCTTVQHNHTPPTAPRRAMPPDALPAHVARGVDQSRGVTHVLPLPAVRTLPIVQGQTVEPRLHIDTACDVAVAAPLPATNTSRLQSPCTVDLANVQRPAILCTAFGHDGFLKKTEINWEVCYFSATLLTA